jgi:hypothetical protein
MMVIGAGMAGLLAANLLRGSFDGILERAESLPHNHSAVLRFRSSIVGDAINIPFKKVRMMKASQSWRNPVADALAYSQKSNGQIQLRSISSAGPEFHDRFIAPSDFIPRMAHALGRDAIAFGQDASTIRWGAPVISTMPMPALMKELGWPADKTPEFRSTSGRNLIAQIEGCEAYCTVYVPSPDLPFSRVSITGGELIAEQADTAVASPESIARLACWVVGITTDNIHSIEVRDQKYAKILPIDEGTRREFIMWASREFSVFSLGRFATWRPGLLLDDVVNDVRVIQRLTNETGATYPHAMKG